MSSRTRWILPVIITALWLPADALAGPDSGGQDISSDKGTPAVCGDKKCEAGKEYCDTCEKDCGACNGCQPRSKAKCPSCQCEACVCTADPYCCNKRWDSVCASQCKSKCTGCTLLDGSMKIDGLGDAAPDQYVLPGCGDGKCNPSVEFCDSCPKDCGKCNGCQAQLQFGCPGCACEKCVCNKDSYCCSVQWDVACANICKTCGACSVGDLGLPDAPPDMPPAPKCGDGKCDYILEFCDTCPKDCGKCDGCDMRFYAKCPGCACQSCVCAKDAYCCDSQWDSYCALSCKSRCAGCGTTDGGADIPKPADQSPDQPPPGVCGNGKCETTSETCDSCPKDCGKCTGCQPRSKKGCPGCACEACVCKMDPDCCKLTWDHICVSECDKYCGGNCKLKDAGVDFAAVDLSPDQSKKKDSAPPDANKDLKKDASKKDSAPPDVKKDQSKDAPKNKDKDPPMPDGPPDPPMPDGPLGDRNLDQPLPDNTKPSDVYFADKPPPGKKRGPGNPGHWECGCAATVPDASGLPMLLLPLLWYISRRRRT